MMLGNLKRICIESQELMCLMGSLEIIKHIVKFGMVQQYPHLLRHLDGLMKIDDQQMKFQEITKFIEKIAGERVLKSRKLI